MTNLHRSVCLLILTLIATGATNRRIARSLGLSEATVRHYVSNLLRKLGVTNRVEAAVFASGQGLTGPEPERASKLTPRNGLPARRE